MLYFLLVLGLVPGTSIQLTFLEVMMLTGGIFLIFIWRLRLFTESYHQASELASIRRRASRKLSLDELKMAQWIPRTTLAPPERISRSELYSRAEIAH